MNAVTKAWMCLLLAWSATTLADDFASLCADRTAIERVYYNHRTGNKPAFDQVSPPALIQRLAREDLHKEAVLRKVYAVDITPAMLAAEGQRINTTTRAPDTLAELKAALGNDADRFARAVARPIVVERLLRERFENDDTLHAAQRDIAEKTRDRLLAAKNRNEPLANLIALLKQDHSGQVSETTWILTARPAETNAPSPDELEIKKRFGPDAQILSSPTSTDRERKLYFEDLPTPLQNVLRVQLRQPRDMSAVIEMPNGFLLYVAKARTADTLDVAMLSLPKRSYEQWLSEQTEIKAGTHQSN
jgi:hypothetical protein